MASTKRALLIGSSFGSLPGTENDVKMMADVLMEHGFQRVNMKMLCGSDATRQKILDAWKQLISESSKNDSLVIYYSGHGGLAEHKAQLPGPTQEPQFFQFLVPYDYDPTLEHWLGILDSEISKLLLDTTRQTNNVTYILDCCHSSRLGRKPGLGPAWPKAVSTVLSTSDYDRIVGHVKQLRERRELLENDCWFNPNVVRIAAAADNDTAWQYQNAEKEHVGILTENLVHVLRRRHEGEQAFGRSSWRNLMVEVCALVEEQFPKDKLAQRPRSAGPDSRTPFSEESDWSKVLVAEVKSDHVLIQGGRVHGVHPGDSFTLTPFKSDPQNKSRATTATATTVVQDVRGFLAVGSPISRDDFPYDWALARSLHLHNRWPIRVPKELDQIHALLNKSGIFGPCSADQKCLVEFRLGGENSEKVALYGGGVQLGSGDINNISDILGLFSVANNFAQAQEVLSFEKGCGEEELKSNLEIQVGVARNRKEEVRGGYNRMSTTEPEPIRLAADEKYYIRVEYKGEAPIYVNVIHVDAAGKVLIVSRVWELGFQLAKERPRMLLADSPFPIEGIPVGWPKSIPRHERVQGAFVFVITSAEVDLGFLETSSPTDYFVARARAQGTETASRQTLTTYDVVRMKYHVHLPDAGPGRVEQADLDQRPVTAAQLSAPEATKGWEEISSNLQEQAAAAKGVIGAAIRILKDVPPCVWVVNEHIEDITVVVSKYRPNQAVSGGGFTADFMGAGFNIETTTFLSPATTKSLAPQARDPERSIAMFPLWTRAEGFGVISIFTGPDKMLYIDNDRVPIGATVYFKNQPDLKIVEWDKRGMSAVRQACRFG